MLIELFFYILQIIEPTEVEGILVHFIRYSPLYLLGIPCILIGVAAVYYYFNQSKGLRIQISLVLSPLLIGVVMVLVTAITPRSTYYGHRAEVLVLMDSLFVLALLLSAWCVYKSKKARLTAGLIVVSEVWLISLLTMWFEFVLIK